MTLKRRPVKRRVDKQSRAQLDHYNRTQRKAKKLKKGETKRGIGPAGGAPVSKKTGKVFTGHKGTKRSIGPAGAPVSKTTGKVFTGKKGKARKPKEKLYPKIYSKLFGKKPLTT